MSLPPLNLLLPHIHTFKDEFTDYPLHITSTTPAAVLTILFLHHASHRTEVHEPSGSVTRGSILINCNGSKETFLESLVSEESALSGFFKGSSTGKGKFLYAASLIKVIHVTTLHELRALLFLLSMEGIEAAIDQDENVPDSQDSPDDDDEEESSRGSLPILALSGLDSLLREAGELSAQGLLKVLASAIDAVEDKYHLIIHDSIPVDAEINLVNDPSRVPESMADVSTTFRKCYARYIACDWVVSGYGQSQGQWQYLDGLGYKVFWQQNDDGECVDSRMERIR